MAELFKNIYNKTLFNTFTKTVLKVHPDFNKESFLKHIFDTNWEDRELKQRMRHITITLKNHLFDDYAKNVDILLKTIIQLQKDGYRETSIEYMFFPDFIEVYGLENYDLSIKAFEQITQFTSCEFAVRPFIIQYESKMVSQMLLWSKHEYSTVRRLSSEGCRPRLPWAMAIPFLKKNPVSIIPILENLKNDDSEFVRRSVANNLNDISKDNPETVINIVKNWQGETTETDWLIKHASRTLLKQGSSEIMAIFGFGAVDNIKIENFKVLTPEVKIGAFLEFACQLVNNSATKSKIRLEYGLYYQKANGTLSRKVFKISEKEYSENSITSINRKQSFKLITTRKFHLGLHQVALIANGKEFDKYSFELI